MGAGFGLGWGAGAGVGVLGGGLAGLDGPVLAAFLRWRATTSITRGAAVTVWLAVTVSLDVTARVTVTVCAGSAWPRMEVVTVSI